MTASTDIPNAESGSCVESVDHPAVVSVDNDAFSAELEKLREELDEKTKKIGKLNKYIAKVEADGDRLNNELVIANSYRNCFDSITNPLFMVTKDLEIHYANKAFFEMTGSSPQLLQQQVKCSDFMLCGRFREKCLLQECFENKQPIVGFACKYVSREERKFSLVVDALPICNVATGQLLGGIEVFRDVVEETTTEYLMFTLAGQEYGISVKSLREVVPMVDITKLPNAPDYVRGVVNLRGQVVPLIDLTTRFGLQRVQSPDGEVIVVLTSKFAGEGAVFGVVVDRVDGICAIDSHDVESLPSLGEDQNGNTTYRQYVGGIAKQGGRATVLLKCEGLIGSWESTNGSVAV